MSRKRKWFFIALAVLLAVIIGGPAGYLWYRNHQLDQELQAVLAELDESDPGWRIEEIEAARPALAEHKNSALRVVAIYDMMPLNWGNVFYEAREDNPHNLPPSIQLNEWQTEALRSELMRVQPALQYARQLRYFPKGCYQIGWADDGISTSYEDTQKARQVASLLDSDILLLCQEKQIEQAWESGQALYRVNTSIGNPDSLILLLIRISIRAVAVSGMERVLAQGEVSDVSLAQTQRMLEDDLNEPILWHGMRGERAILHRIFLALEKGDLALDEMFGPTGKNTPPALQLLDSLTGTLQTSHIWILQYMNECVEAAKLPAEEKIEQLREIEQEKLAPAKRTLFLYPAAVFLPAISKVAEADVRAYVSNQCAICALACERYRLRYHRWPESLDELAENGFIVKVPIDPYDGKPLRYKKTENGIVVHSVGDGVFSGYDGELLDDPSMEPLPFYLGFHLWNPEKRRQPARAIQKPEAEAVQYTDLWTSGDDGYHTYRIPALIVTKKDTLLAFCEGRRDSARDDGDIDLLVKRSTDDGMTWSKQQVVYGEEGKITIGNPCPVVDQKTGIIWLPFTRNNDDVMMTHSKDDGQTWAKPVKITESVKKKGWGWYATGPGVGIQMEKGKHKGRLVIPCDHRFGKPGVTQGVTYSHAFYSDDHGKSWQLGKAVANHTNECQVAELPEGNLLINMRNLWGRDGKEKAKDRMRAVAVSKDGGDTWEGLRFDKTLIEPICQASLIRYSWPDDWNKSILLFSNPASRTSRINMTVRLSYDDGKTWPVSRSLDKGPSAYSCLARLPDGDIGCLYEGGEKLYQKIRFARFSLDWLERGF